MRAQPTQRWPSAPNGPIEKAWGVRVGVVELGAGGSHPPHSRTAGHPPFPLGAISGTLEVVQRQSPPYSHARSVLSAPRSPRLTGRPTAMARDSGSHRHCTCMPHARVFPQGLRELFAPYGVAHAELFRKKASMANVVMTSKEAAVHALMALNGLDWGIPGLKPMYLSFSMSAGGDTAPLQMQMPLPNASVSQVQVPDLSAQYAAQYAAMGYPGYGGVAPGNPQEYQAMPAMATSYPALPQAMQPLPQMMQPLPQMMQPLPQMMQPLPQMMQPLPQMMQPLPQVGQPLAQAMQPLPQTMQPLPQAMQPLPQTMQPLPQTMQPLPQTMQASAAMPGVMPGATSGYMVPPAAAPAPVPGADPASGLMAGLQPQ